MIHDNTYLFFAWLLLDGSAFLFLGPSGTGVSRGLLAFAFVALLPKTLLMARSMGTPPFATFSTLRLFCGGLLVAVVEMPNPTLLSAAFRDLLL